MRKDFVENIFFFGLLGFVSYLVWQIVAPFIAPLALAGIIATVCYPLFLRIVRIMPKKNRSLASMISVVLIAVTIFAPLFLLSYILFIQVLDFYNTTSGGGSMHLQNSLTVFESLRSEFFPGLSVDFALYAKEAAGWIASHMGTIFAGTASTVLMLFIMLIALFYMLRDGPSFLEQLVRMSPLPDGQDERILQKLSLSVRSVVLGTLAIALIQGVLTAIGFTLFSVSQPVLWGSIAAVGALIPGVGTSIVFIVAITFSLLSGSYGVALGLAIWGFFAVGLIDNFLGPYLMSRGVELHPFMILLAVLGGVTLFGPIGFLLGPVALSLFTVLLELYSLHIRTKKEHVG